MSETHNPTPPVACRAVLVDTLPALQELTHHLLSGPDVAVDTESDSLFSYSEKLCLVQFSTRTDDYIVDPLAVGSLEPLGVVFASDEVEKVFHGADYDIVSFKRQYGFTFRRVFDTMLAGRVLGHKNCGLGALLERYLGIKLDKTMQRSDWGRRPLSEEQLAYACHDTHYLLDLRDRLLEDLRAQGREEETREILADLPNLEARNRVFDPDGFWNLNGVRDLDSAGQRVARVLYQWREDQARWEDRPVFKIMGDRTLVALARTRPSSYDALRQSHLLSSYNAARYGRHLSELIAKAVRSAEQPVPPRRRHEGERPDDATLLLFEALRAWRKEQAAQRGVEPDVVCSNDTLMALAVRRPRSAEELEGIPGLGPWRRRQYGSAILEVVARTAKARRVSGTPDRPRGRHRQPATIGRANTADAG